jgi:hypothetical protein
LYQVSVDQPITTRKRSQKIVEKSAAQKKKKLTGIALVDHILAQNALLEQQRPSPPAHSPQQEGAAQQQLEAATVPLRRSKRLAERADTGSADKQPANPKKRKTAPMNARKTKLAEEAIQEPIFEETACRAHPVTGTPLKTRRKSFAEDVVQFIWSLSPVRANSSPEKLSIAEGNQN